MQTDKTIHPVTSLADPEQLTQEIVQKLLTDGYHAGEKIHAVCCFALFFNERTTKAHWGNATWVHPNLQCEGKPMTEGLLFRDVAAAAMEMLIDILE